MAGVFANVLNMTNELLTSHALQYLETIWSGDDERQLQKLKSSLVYIQPRVEDAEGRQLTNEAVRYWLLLLKDAVCDAEDILDEAKTRELVIQRKAELSGRSRSKVRACFSLDHNNPLLFKLQLGKKLRNINERIDRLMEDMVKYELRLFEKNCKPFGDRPQTYSYVPQSRDILGRDEDREKVVQMLIRDNFDEKVAVVSIVGMGGQGKTTLAQMVYGDERVKMQFEQCIWVCVSDEFDVPQLAGKIIHTATGQNCGHTNTEVLQQRLREVLGQKRYLLVLDDVWNDNFQKWDSLRNMLLVGGKGSRILVTTRNERYSRVMGTQKPYILSGLSVESSWALFEKKVFAIDAPRPPKLVEIGKKIVKKCQGLPLAIQVLSCIMRNKSGETEWKAVLENETWKSQHTKNEILPGLWLSYVDLPAHLKKCFAFCAIFPKDKDIVEEELIQFWIAHGFIPSENGNDMEVEGQEIFTELIERSLLQYDCSLHESDSGRVCTMHDLIHDLAEFAMGNQCFTSLKSSATPEIPIKPRHYSNSFVDEDSLEGDCSIIRTVLYWPRDHGVLPKLKLVRVLNLSNASIEELHALTEHLQHLRFLHIFGTGITKLPESICMLVNLQTLKLSGCPNLSELPKSITYMNSLRHLIFDDCRNLKAFFAGLSRLQNLKTLTRYTVGDDADYNIRQLKLLNLGGKVQLYNLQKVKNAGEAQEANLRSKQNIHTLKLNWRESNSWKEPYDQHCSTENAEEVLEALKPHDKVKSLEVISYPSKQFPMWMSERQLFQYLRQITLKKCEKCEQLPPLETLPCLEELNLYKMNGIKHIVNYREGNTLGPFPALKELTLCQMRNLEGWCVERGRETDLSLFPRLFVMTIERCPKLTATMPPTPTLQALSMVDSFGESQTSPERSFFKHLESLRSLEIRYCPEELVLLLEDEEETRAMKSSLEYLSICKCNQLSLALVLQNLTSLRDICVDSLEKLESWPDCLRGLKSLDTLTIRSCKNFTGTSSHGDCCPPSPKDHSKSLKVLTILNCPVLESLWPEMGHLTSLSYLFLSACPKLVSLSGLSGLSSLEVLSISVCPGLKSFPEDLQQRLPILKSLTIQRCPELERLCKAGGDYYNLLSTVRYKQIGMTQPKDMMGAAHENFDSTNSIARCRFLPFFLGFVENIFYPMYRKIAILSTLSSRFKPKL